MRMEVTTNEFGGVVDAEETDLFPAEVFCHFLELRKKQDRFPTFFHEEQGDEAGVVINEKDVIRKVPIATGKRSTYVAVDAFKKACGMDGSSGGKGKMRNVGMSTDFTGGGGGVIKR